MGLLMVILASVALVLLTILGEGVVRVVLGLIFALFFPGYTLIVALFPKQGDLDSAERVALSFGLSIAVVPLIGLIVNYTPWGIRLYPILVSILAFIVIMAGVAWYRRRRLPPEQRFEIRFRPKMSWLSGSWGRQSGWNRVLSGLLVVAIIGTIGVLVYNVQMPKVEEKFTEFYILGPGGKAENYPRVLAIGEKAKVTLVIVNREHEVTEYRVKTTIDAKKAEEIGPITLPHEEKWEREMNLVARRIGEEQKVEFQLYKEPGKKPYRRLNLWIDVVESR